MLRHPHPAPHSWDEAQKGREINQVGEGWSEKRGRGAGEMSGGPGWVSCLPLASCVTYTDRIASLSLHFLSGSVGANTPRPPP